MWSMNAAISAESLKVFSFKTADPEVLLGPTFLAPVGSPVRRELRVVRCHSQITVLLCEAVRELKLWFLFPRDQ